MSGENALLGVPRSQQALLIGVVGVALAAYGLVSSSAVDASYDPLPFTIGLLMVVYAGGVVVHDRFLA